MARHESYHNLLGWLSPELCAGLSGGDGDGIGSYKMVTLEIDLTAKG